MKAKSLTFRIFINTFLTGTFIYFFCTLIFISTVYKYFEKQIFNELETESQFLIYPILSDNLEEIKNIETTTRITLIHPDGTVYFDNQISPDFLDNHTNRTEFQKALKNGSTKISRYSSSMTEKNLYYAKLLPNKDVLRISCTQRTIWNLISELKAVLITVFLLAIFISGAAAHIIARRLLSPLNDIDLDNPDSSKTYYELQPFLKRIADENLEKEKQEEIRQQFTANVSHELKTPLTSISGFAEIIKQGTTDQKTTVDFAKSIYEESQQMIALINDIIRLSKLDAKSISLEKENFSLKETCKDAKHVLEASAAARNISMSIDGDEGIIYGVRPVVYEMVYNLIDNAIKYNKKNGSVEIKIKTMTENYNPKKTTVVLMIRDTGIGIPKNEQGRIFERFYRIDKSRSRAMGGTGLGLSIVKHAAKYHDAIILLNSEENKGSIFTVIFNQ
ncbi:two-component sensor histidine kinase [Treponema rectale]|uniref:histidine kinase n=1 Tax=Treponema rectale TaxID=744512 RepID=A0A840SFY9_9SPIR|nr:ATP-binding protein [Treponema rectale]MBB5219078.1 two-component system phosphate regulon sensor histidine kinase PhoR [Treponema rectale]QOS41017.1 two-component sensor histidine kinase [Treponema rectale]